MHAVGNHIMDQSPWMKVAYITSERFTNDLVEAIRDKSTEAFRNRYRQLDVLLIDDVHFLKDRTWTQEELFHTFNELYDSKKQIVFSSDRPPEEISQLQDRLVTRFRWGTGRRAGESRCAH
jgi:chromosomal replication initiator protein